MLRSLEVESVLGKEVSDLLGKEAQARELLASYESGWKELADQLAAGRLSTGNNVKDVLFIQYGPKVAEEYAGVFNDVKKITDEHAGSVMAKVDQITVSNGYSDTTTFISVLAPLSRDTDGSGMTVRKSFLRGRSRLIFNTAPVAAASFTRTSDDEEGLMSFNLDSLKTWNIPFLHNPEQAQISVDSQAGKISVKQKNQPDNVTSETIYLMGQEAVAQWFNQENLNVPLRGMLSNLPKLDPRHGGHMQLATALGA